MFNYLTDIELTAQEQLLVSLTSYVNYIGIIIAFFVFKAVAIRTLAKNKGLDKLYLAWIPFLNYILLGKVVGTCFLFRKKIKNIGVLVAIFTFISFVVYTLLNLGYYINEAGYLFLGIENITKSITGSSFVYNWLNGQGLFYMISYYAYGYVVSIPEIILKTTLIVFVFRKYVPERAFLFIILSMLLEVFLQIPALGIFLFIIRNRKPMSYDDFLRTRIRTDYAYYNPKNQYTKNPENDPFPEFKNNNENKTDNSDDFFN